MSANWNHRTNIDCFATLPNGKSRLCLNICGRFRIPTNGVAIIFDEFDYHQSELYLESIWIRLGNHLNLQEGDGFNETSPPKIRNLIYSLKYSHLIWLSKRAWKTEDIEFAWTLSHELRHLEQDLENHFLSLAGNLLVSSLKGLKIEEPKLWIIIPTELDAELAAWRTVNKIFNPQRVNLHLNYQGNLGENKEHFQLLTMHNPDNFYDVRVNTIELLQKYKPQLNEFISINYEGDSKFQNVDDICLELKRT